MPEGLGPRFALEAGFLILLAAVAAYARLNAAEIILVMAGGWLLASLFEVLAARRERLYPGAAWERRVEVVEKPAEREADRRLSWFRRPAEVAAPPEQEPVAAEAEPVAAEAEPVGAEAEPVAAEAEPVAAEAEPVAAEHELLQAEPEAVAAHEQPPPAAEEEEEGDAAEDVVVAKEPEPVSPPARQVDDEATGEIARAAPKRRWFRRTRPEPEERPEEAIARPSARHVRLIRGTESEGPVTEERQDAEAGS
jgi:hypothetical protein